MDQLRNANAPFGGTCGSDRRGRPWLLRSAPRGRDGRYHTHNYRSLIVASAIVAKTACTSQNRTTTCVSLHPFFWK